MATILLSAAGAAIGGSIGGTVAGLSMAVVGRFAGATLGRVLDQRLLGEGSAVVEAGRVDRFRVTGSGEGDPIAQVFGRFRVGGQVIWASEFQEHVTKSGGGKGMAPSARTRQYSYTVNLAIALCEGEIAGVLRVWADGTEVSKDDLNLRIYRGDQEQLPDPKMEAIEGVGKVPAYRGTAYVVMEDLALEQFGNRVPQFTFELSRPDLNVAQDAPEPALAVTGVAMMPGSGEYALATTPAVFDYGPGNAVSANINTPSGKSDFATSVEMLNTELPNCGATSLIVSWFGDDLRAGQCEMRPKVEQNEHDADSKWQVAGLDRDQAELIARQDDRPVYGGTPSDASVVEAIQHLQETGQAVMYYPFLLMEQLADNGLPDPWSDAEDQPVLPWRGRITGEKAPGQPGSPDGTLQAEQEVAVFFGTAGASDFQIADGKVTYTGPDEWSYRRFILHNAALCAAAGGVDSFCIGSEMRGLTQLRGAAGSFPAVAQLRQLASEVRTLLGSGVKLGYAADWSEYFGYQPEDGSGDRYFHLDPLWADAEIDFIGIDNYMPLSDWRDGQDHLDGEWSSIYDLDYLCSNIEGGEGYDWYYHSPEAQEAQIRTPITDGAYDEPWVYRYKDIRNWWHNPHHERIAGQRQNTPTDWVPQSKPIWFTELGCAAIDKGTNQPNKFLDPKSSESRLPKYSDGRRDDLMQMQYLRAMFKYWGDQSTNPVSEVYEAPMVDMSRAFVWAWDARPFPHFPANTGLWSDGENYARGHWLTGRASARSLASVVSEICQRAGLVHFDVSGLHGFVRGYVIQDVDTARAALQPLMLRYGFDAIERGGVLTFVQRDGVINWDIDAESLAEDEETQGRVELRRSADSEISGRLRLKFIQADADFEVISEEAVLPDEETHSVAASQFPISMTRGEGRQTVERWLSEARVARDSIRLSLPPSALEVGAGDVVRLPLKEGEGLYRVDRVEVGAAQIIEAVRIEPETYRPVDMVEEPVSLAGFVAPLPVFPVFMDLPLMRGDEVPHAPHLALTANPWPGSVAVYSSPTDADYRLNTLMAARATVGVTQTALPKARAGLLDRGAGLQVKLSSGALESVEASALLNGANLAAIGDGSSENWELFQFQSAELVDDDTYLLRNRLRGQLGSDANMPDEWPAGSMFVLLDGSLEQLDLAVNSRNVSQHFRIGSAFRPYDDPSYVHTQQAFSGVGLRPLAPAHLQVNALGNGDMQISALRRTRIGGDSWDGLDVPLGEEREAYLLRILVDGQIKREVELDTPLWTYALGDQQADGAETGFNVSLAQVSAIYGAGAFRSLNVA